MELQPELVAKLNSSGKVYEVGGSVRDSLMSPPRKSEEKDYLVVGIPLNRLEKILQGFGRLDLVGKSFGVIKFTPRGKREAIDIALPRTEMSTGARHRDFEVACDPKLPVEADLRRRDFTINAMARAVPSGELIDPCGGRQDLKRKLIRMVFPEAIIEDPLRILRGVQLAARLQFTIESATLRAMEEAASLIDTVSPERIAEELNKMLSKAEKPSIGFRYLQEIGVLERILPELAACVGVEQPGGYHRWDVFEHTLACVDEAPRRLTVRLAALFHDVGKPGTRKLVDGGATFYGHDKLSSSMAREAMKRLHYSNDLIRNVSALVSKHMFSERAGEKGIRRLIRAVGEDTIYDLVELRRADTLAQGTGQNTEGIDEFRDRVRAEIEKKPPFGVKDLEISGNDIMAEFGLEEGPIIGEILNHLLEMVLDDPSANTRQSLLSQAKAFLAQKRA